jgi:hypothetical protein
MQQAEQLGPSVCELSDKIVSGMESAIGDYQ